MNYKHKNIIFYFIKIIITLKYKMNYKNVIQKYLFWNKTFKKILKNNIVKENQDSYNFYIKDDLKKIMLEFFFLKIRLYLKNLFFYIKTFLNTQFS